MCQMEHLVKMYLKMNILVKMTFDLVKNDKEYLYYLSFLWVSLVKMAFGLVKSDKGHLYYVSTLGVSLVKMAFGLVRKDKYCLYRPCVLNLVLDKLNIYNVNNVCFIFFGLIPNMV